VKRLGSLFWGFVSQELALRRQLFRFITMSHTSFSRSFGTDVA
jgi:hypothetical protein